MLKRYAAGLAVLLIASFAAGCTPQFGPPPTGVPVTVIVTVVLTPTPVPATPAPPAAATLTQATATQAPATSAPTVTAMPATSTKAPASPTSAPSATAVVGTPGPSPTPCPNTISVGGDFAQAYTTAKLQQGLGCPTAGATTLKTSFQPFEHGIMFWRDDTRHVYALSGTDNTWHEYADTWVDGEPEYSCPDASTPSTTPPTPRRGFGKVWCTQTDARSKLGKALGDEKGYDRTVQDFQGGSMVLIPEYSGAPLVLYKDSGRWQLVK